MRGRGGRRAGAEARARNLGCSFEGDPGVEEALAVNDSGEHHHARAHRGASTDRAARHEVGAVDLDQQLRAGRCRNAHAAELLPPGLRAQGCSRLERAWVAGRKERAFAQPRQRILVCGVRS